MTDACKCSTCISGHPYTVSSCQSAYSKGMRYRWRIAYVCTRFNLRRRQCPCKACATWRAEQRPPKEKLKARVLPPPSKQPATHAVLELIGYQQNVLPPWVLGWLDARHLTNDIRFSLTKFLFGNGVSPELIMDFYRERHALLLKLRRGEYVASDGWKQIETVLKNCEERNFGPTAEWYFDLATRHMVSIKTGKLKPRARMTKKRGKAAFDHARAEQMDWAEAMEPPKKKKKKRRRVWAPKWELVWNREVGWVRQYRSQATQPTTSTSRSSTSRSATAGTGTTSSSRRPAGPSSSATGLPPLR